MIWTRLALSPSQQLMTRPWMKGKYSAIEENYSSDRGLCLVWGALSWALAVKGQSSEADLLNLED